MPLSWARAPARDGPSSSRRERCLRSKPFVLIGADTTRDRGGAASCALSARGDAAGRARRAAQALALPLAQAPEVAAHLLGVDLAAGQVHVRGRDQVLLVAGERHPLGQHVVGVGQARAAVGPRLVGELDAVLVEQLAGLREVGDDRPVGVDEVGVRRAGARIVADAPASRHPRHPAPHADEPEVAVHRPLLVVDARLQQLAGALLGAALAARVVGRAGDRGRGAPGGARRPP